MKCLNIRTPIFFACYCRLLIFFKINFFKKFFQGYYQCQTVWIQIRTDILSVMSVLIWVQTVCKGYQQTTKLDASKERFKGVNIVYFGRCIFDLGFVYCCQTCSLSNPFTCLLTLYPGIFFPLFCCLLIFFFKINFFRKILSGIRSVSNTLDPDQAQHSVGRNLGTNCFQKSSADNTRRYRVNVHLAQQ